VNNRVHQKLFIIDDHSAITGGMNVGDDYARARS
jgi:phosphatidylserine/phosphatidylglycerophosphate/cardiolipin synthase-like enzyme